MVIGLSDARLERRLAHIVTAMTKHPDRSFPHAMGDGASLEATYRFLSNERVDWQTLLAPEIARTVETAATHNTCLAVHDSTMFMLGGEVDRDDIGSLDGTGPSFMGHFALAVTDSATVLGLLSLEPLFRPTGPRNHARNWRARNLSSEKESLRWLRGVDSVAAATGNSANVIHLMDAEGDSYELLAHLVNGGHRFVVRGGSTNRQLTSGEYLLDVLDGAEAVACRQVPISKRTRLASRGRKSSHREREARLANLHIRATKVELRRPDRMKHFPASLSIHVVQVVEQNAPEGTQPVDWKLYTTESIDTPEQIIAIVDYYRRRWLIEEYFKALKTGCSYEKRQLENRRALLNALAILAPIACQILKLRKESCDEATETTSLSAKQVEILRSVSKRKLPPNPSAREIMFAVAGIGGHIKNNGDPGWLVLGRGFLDLLAFEVGWNARERSDQS